MSLMMNDIFSSKIMSFSLFKSFERKRELILKNVKSTKNDKLIFFNDEKTMLTCTNN